MKLYKILWNSLPQNMVELLSLASFKDRWAKHFRNRKMNFFLWDFEMFIMETLTTWKNFLYGAG